MNNIIKITFGRYEYIPCNSDGIDSDRYIIPFTLTFVKEPPYADEKTNHRIKVSIAGSDLATKSLWNCTQSEIPKIVYAHTYEYLKAMIFEDKINEKYEIILDRIHLTKYKLDIKKIPDINEFEFIIDLSERKKVFGFKP